MQSLTKKPRLAPGKSATAYDDLVKTFHNEIAQETKKYNVLKDLDIFVLDNSIRESTVGQLRGHTIENKWKIYNEVKKLGFKNTIVASFAHMTRVDDVFIQQLCDRGEDRSGLFAFSEITEGITNKVPDTTSVPVGLLKMEKVGLYNIIFELDLGDGVYDFDAFPMTDMCALLNKWVTWCHDRLHPEAKVFISFRDLPDTMPYHPERVFQTVEYLAKMPAAVRPFGLMFEEPRGESLPEECGTYAKYIRKVMLDNKWNANLLVHSHQKWGYCDATALQVLMSGATGIWASVCTEGAAMGNASSCVTLMNLIRLGNKKVLKKFNCSYLRQAAINVTKITTGMEPHIKQPVYGGRALDFVFDLNPEEFDLSDFFGEHPPVRITTLASPEMIQSRMIFLFGEDPQFTIDRAYKMKECMLADLRSSRKEEYMSEAGLALLFDRAGGALTPAMRDAVTKMKMTGPHANRLFEEIKMRWDTWDSKDKVQNDNMLEFFNFYNGFMAPYFACYRCSDTRRAMQAIDMDADGQVDWSEFMVYLKWAIHQYPMIKDADELLDVAFRKGIIPAMRDEMLRNRVPMR